MSNLSRLEFVEMCRALEKEMTEEQMMEVLELIGSGFAEAKQVAERGSRCFQTFHHALMLKGKLMPHTTSSHLFRHDHLQKIVDRYVPQKASSLPPGKERSLFDAVEKLELGDLHTHLLGMGSHNFWIDTVIKKLIPALRRKKQIEFYGRENVTHDNIYYLEGENLAMPEFSSKVFLKDKLHLCSPGLQDELKKSSNIDFTYDVVFDKNALKEALFPNFDSQRPEEITDDLLLEKLGLDRSQKSMINRERIVFNAREQWFEIRKGILNADVLDFIDRNDALRKAFSNCFSMLDFDGNEPTSAFMKSKTRLMFRPEFYPMRYRLKDELYSQYLEVLDSLLHHVITQVYVPNGVGYVEFSVGISDVMNRPWVWRHLVESVKDSPVQVRYLAGFQREKLARTLSSEKMHDAFDPALYETHLKELEVLRTKIESKYLMDRLVGLDYLGNEEDRPYCPFGLPEFCKYVMEVRKKHNGRFGLRYHCGEFFFDPQKKQYQSHMAISAQIIQRIIDSFDHQALPLRIGHGVAFLHYIPMMHLEDLDKGRKCVVDALVSMKRARIPIEVNLRSNNVLLLWGDKINDWTLKDFIGVLGVDVILCTDDEGIWEIVREVSGRKFSSVAGEFAKVLNAFSDITTSDFESLFNWKRYCFTDIPMTANLEEQVAPGSSFGPFLRTSTSGAIESSLNDNNALASASVEDTISAGDNLVCDLPNEDLLDLALMVGTFWKDLADPNQISMVLESCSSSTTPEQAAKFFDVSRITKADLARKLKDLDKERSFWDVLEFLKNVK